MNMKSHAFWTAAACGMAMAGAVVPAQAQRNTAPERDKVAAPAATNDTEARQYIYIRVRNVPVRVMAWWIDPQHQPVPAESVLPELRQTNPFQGQAGKSDFQGQTSQRSANVKKPAGGGVFSLLPEGIDQIVVVDPNNALLVYGTAQGVENLMTIVSHLDKPLRQVEIEARFVEISRRDLEKFGGVSMSEGPPSSNGAIPNGQTQMILGFVRGNFHTTLDALVKAGRAKIIDAPRVTAINNLMANLSASRTFRLAISEVTMTDKGPVAAEQPRIINVKTKIDLNVTPTINNDDTITQVLQFQVQSLADLLTQQAPLAASQRAQMVVNTRDGDTVFAVVTPEALPLELVSSPPTAPAAPRSADKRNIVVFLTARIIRRLEEAAPAP